MHVFNTRHEGIVFVNLFNSISAIVHHVVSLYNTKENAKIMQFYFETKAVVLTQRCLRAHFKVKTAP